MADGSATRVHETTVCGETAISCLILLSRRFNPDLDTEKLRTQWQFPSDVLSISELIQLVNDFGFRAEYTRRDWSWLQSALATQPILLFLKNGNAIVSVGTGRVGAEEIVVCDPRHRSGVPIVLSRGDIERAWGGDTVTITPSTLAHERSEPNGDAVVTQEPVEGARLTQISTRPAGMDFMKIVGIALIALLIAIAGDASLGIPGLVIGLLIGISVAVSLVRLLRVRMSEGHAFDPMPTWSMVSDLRHEADQLGRRRA